MSHGGGGQKSTKKCHVLFEWPLKETKQFPKRTLKIYKVFEYDDEISDYELMYNVMLN